VLNILKPIFPARLSRLVLLALLLDSVLYRSDKTFLGAPLFDLIQS
jgi:hypothetical protein